MRVAIIGAGCSGLAAVKSCLEENFIPVCFERESDIGGLWNYSDSARYGSGGVYKSCTINTSKEMMAFSDFPPPSDFPMFMPHEYVLKYFRLYADHFRLLPYIKFSTSVLNVTKSGDYESSGRWSVTYSKEGTLSRVTEIFDAVMVCSGHHTCPKMPRYEGLDKFQGSVIHSHGYKKPQDYEDKRVLIVGAGNSAADIAVDLSRVAKQVYMSTKRGSWVVGRVGPFGMPCDALANSRVMFSIPKSVLQWGVEVMANFKFDHETYGIKPRHRALEAHPTINDDLPYTIATGRVKIKSDINQFEENQETCKLPSQEEMKKDIEEKQDIIRQSYLSTERHTLETFWIEYMDEIASQFGAKPNFRTLFSQDPMLAMRCFLGPCVPAQYRLFGPGKWEGARGAIFKCLSNCREVTKTRLVPKREQKVVTHEIKEMWFLYLIIMCCLFLTWLFTVY